VTDYFSEKIERTCAFYEAQSRKIDAKYLAEVEKLASRFDWVLADFIRSTVRPTRIRSAVESVRCSLQAGDIVAADQKLERLRTDLNYVEGHLRRRYFQTGITLSEAGRKAAARRSRSHEDRDVEMALEYCRRAEKGNQPLSYGAQNGGRKPMEVET
jgi:hypothetical protein